MEHHSLIVWIGCYLSVRENRIEIFIVPAPVLPNRFARRYRRGRPTNHPAHSPASSSVLFPGASSSSVAHNLLEDLMTFCNQQHGLFKETAGVGRHSPPPLAALLDHRATYGPSQKSACGWERRAETARAAPHHP